jgi:4-aminobutyrate aminotransferase-like enzyme
MEFFSTFGGSTVSCAVGATVLELVHQEHLQAHAQEVGAHLLAKLRGLMDRHELIGHTRGSGLFLGVELVRERSTLEPATQAASEVVNRMREAGVLIGTDGPFHNVLKIRPPMPFSIENADELADCMDDALTAVGKNC